MILNDSPKRSFPYRAWYWMALVSSESSQGTIALVASLIFFWTSTPSSDLQLGINCGLWRVWGYETWKTERKCIFSLWAEESAIKVKHEVVLTSLRLCRGFLVALYESAGKVQGSAGCLLAIWMTQERRAAGGNWRHSCRVAHWANVWRVMAHLFALRR